jgi:hypothetical protein
MPPARLHLDLRGRAPLCAGPRVKPQHRTAVWLDFAERPCAKCLARLQLRILEDGLPDLRVIDGKA